MNMSHIEEKNKYLNWYHGFSKIVIPNYVDRLGLQIKLNTESSEGEIMTKGCFYKSILTTQQATNTIWRHIKINPRLKEQF